MAKKQLSEEARKAIVRAKERGDQVRAIAAQFAIGIGTVSRIVNRSSNAKPLTRLPVSGRPRKISERQARVLQRISKTDPRKTAVDIVEEAKRQFGVEISRKTASRILQRVNLNGRRPAKKPLISEKNRRARLKFAKDHLSWTSMDWAKVLWSDESKFNLFSSDGIRYVRRPPGKRFDVRYQVPTVKHSKSVMVWGCFSRDCVGPLFRVEGIMDAVKYRGILDSSMLPHAKDKMPPGWIFQQDNDPKHTSKLMMGDKKKKTSGWFKDQEVDVLQWPAQSPDLNPIEHLWEQLERQLGGRKFKKEADLMSALEIEWKKISIECIVKLLILCLIVARLLSRQMVMQLSISCLLLFSVNKSCKI